MAIAALEAEQAENERLRENIQIGIDDFINAALGSGTGLDEQKLMMDMLRMVWCRLTEKYQTKYKMTTDIFDLSCFWEMREEPITRQDVSINMESQGKWCVKIGNNCWWISCKQSSRFQVLFISPYKDWFTRGKAGLCATYRMPEMLLEINEWKNEIDDMLVKSLQRLRRKCAEDKIQTATVKAYIKSLLEEYCKFYIWVTDGNVTVKAAIKGDKVVSFTFPFGELYDKGPKIRQTVEAMNRVVEDLGAETLPKNPDIFDKFWM